MASRQRGQVLLAVLLLTLWHDEALYEADRRAA